MTRRRSTSVVRYRMPLERMVHVVGAAAGLLLILMSVAQLVAISQTLSHAGARSASDTSAYADHVGLSLAHFVPGITFTVLGGMQFLTRLRRRFPMFHRAAGVVFVLSTVAVGVSGIWMNEILPGAGGYLKYVGAHLFGGAMIVSVALGMRAIFRGDVAGHRAWMMRGYSIGIAVGLQRLIIIPLFLMMGEVGDLTIGVCMWLGWFLALAATEMKLRRGRPAEPSLRLSATVG